METQNSALAGPNRCRTDLAALRIAESRRTSITSPVHRSNLILPSPSLTIARQWYREHASIDRMSGVVSDTLHSMSTPRYPRRHSAFPGATSLVTKLESISLSSPMVPPLTSTAADEKPIAIKLEDFDNSTPTNSKQGDLNRVSSIVSQPTASLDDPARRHSEPSTALDTILRCVPFEYTHDHLHSWGTAYFLNRSTCDAIINAVSLRRPSLFLRDGEDGMCARETEEKTTIRARVLPCEKGRMPFIIQRQFDMDELRKSVPRLAPQGGEEATKVEKKSRYPLRSRRASVQVGSSGAVATKQGRARPLSRSPSSAGSGGIPIHIEYALHYLPVLAALMLSGHVRRRDSIDLPMPHPGAWHDVIAYVYTGGGDLTKAMKENIYFLGGNL